MYRKVQHTMKILSALAILLLTIVMLYFEKKLAKKKKEKGVAAGITIAASILALTLLFMPTLPGPTQLVNLLFGGMDKILK